MDASRQGLVRSLNLPSDVDLRQMDALPSLLDQGSSVDCLAGLLELSRYLLDRAALASSQELVDFLFERVFCDLLVFVFSCPDSLKRWLYREQFSTCLFKQVFIGSPFLQYVQKLKMLVLKDPLSSRFVQLLSTWGMTPALNSKRFFPPSKKV